MPSPNPQYPFFLTYNIYFLFFFFSLLQFSNKAVAQVATDMLQLLCDHVHILLRSQPDLCERIVDVSDNRIFFYWKPSWIYHTQICMLVLEIVFSKLTFKVQRKRIIDVSIRLLKFNVYVCWFKGIPIIHLPIMLMNILCQIDFNKFWKEYVG